MNKIKARKLLEDTCNHYNSENRSVGVLSCTYLPIDEKSQGCAIGRVLPAWAKKEIREKNLNSVEVYDLLDHLSTTPSSLKNLSKLFLSNLQDLHDDFKYWNVNGLSGLGKEKKQEIINKFEL